MFPKIVKMHICNIMYYVLPFFEHICFISMYFKFCANTKYTKTILLSLQAKYRKLKFCKYHINSGYFFPHKIFFWNPYKIFLYFVVKLYEVVTRTCLYQLNSIITDFLVTKSSIQNNILWSEVVRIHEILSYQLNSINMVFLVTKSLFRLFIKKYIFCGQIVCVVN